MAWSFVGAGTRATVGSGGGNASPSLPTGTAENDLLVCEIVFWGNVEFTPPAGWSQIGTSILGATSTTGVGLQRFWIKRGASSPAVTFTRTGGVGAMAKIIAWRPSTGDFGLAASSSGTNASTTTHSVSGVLTVDTDDLLVAVCARITGNAPGTFDATDPGTASGTTAVTTSVTAGTWSLRASEVVTATYTVALGIADALRSTAGATGNVTAVTSSNGVSAMGVACFSESTLPPSESITTDEIEERKVFEGASGSRVMTITGSHGGSTDTIQVQIELQAGGVVVPWQTLQASVAAGAFSGTVTVPRGGWYIAKTRKASSTATESAQTQKWAVGILGGWFGQSLAAYFKNDGTGAPNDRVVIHDGTSFVAMPTTGAGQAALGNALSVYADCPVCLIGTGTGSTSLAYWYNGAKTTPYNTWEAIVTAAGGELSFFMFWQGNEDAKLATTKATYVAGLRSLYTQLRTDYGSSLLGIIPGLGNGVLATETNQNWEDIRDAHATVAADTGNAGVTIVDIPTVDDVHLTSAGSATAGARIALAVADLLGDAANSAGPRISSASLDGSVVTVNIVHDGGTDFTPTSGITGFRVLANGTQATISSAVRASATTVALTLSAPPASPVLVQYGFGAAPAMSAPLVDNGTLSLPLRTTNDDIVVGAVTAPSITSQPSSQTVTEGATATLSVSATGTAPLSYQWQVNTGSGWGNVASGGTSSSYTTGALSVSNNGDQYRVTVSNDAEPAATSSTATITVTAAPVVLDQIVPMILGVTSDGKLVHIISK